MRYVAVNKISKYWLLALILFCFVWFLINERVNHPHRAVTVSLKLGTFSLHEKPEVSPIDSVALQLMAATLAERRRYLSPIVNSVNVSWVETYPPKKIYLREVRFFGDELLDRRDDTVTYTTAKFIQVTPSILQNLADKARTSYVSTDDFVNYGCSKKVFSGKSLLSLDYLKKSQAKQ